MVSPREAFRTMGRRMKRSCAAREEGGEEEGEEEEEEEGRIPAHGERETFHAVATECWYHYTR